MPIILHGLLRYVSLLLLINLFRMFKAHSHFMPKKLEISRLAHDMAKKLTFSYKNLTFANCVCFSGIYCFTSCLIRRLHIAADIAPCLNILFIKLLFCKRQCIHIVSGLTHCILGNFS